MSTHNICFRGEIKKNINTFGLKKKSALTRRVMICPSDNSRALDKEVYQIKIFFLVQHKNIYCRCP